MKFQLMFRLGSIPVRITPSFLLMTLFLGANHRPQPASVMGWVAMAFATVLAHELGHALVYRAFGHAPRILMSAWGGSTYCPAQKPTTIPRLMLGSWPARRRRCSSRASRTWPAPRPWRA
jgi:hypothetical protein